MGTLQKCIPYGGAHEHERVMYADGMGPAAAMQQNLAKPEEAIGMWVCMQQRGPCAWKQRNGLGPRGKEFRIRIQNPSPPYVSIQSSMCVRGGGWGGAVANESHARGVYVQRADMPKAAGQEVPCWVTSSNAAAHKVAVSRLPAAGRSSKNHSQHRTQKRIGSRPCQLAGGCLPTPSRHACIHAFTS